MDDDAESIITNERYLYVASVVKSCCKKKRAGRSLHLRQDRPGGHQPLAGPADLCRGHVPGLLHLSNHRRYLGHRLGQRRRLWRWLALFRVGVAYEAAAEEYVVPGAMKDAFEDGCRGSGRGPRYRH